MKTYSFIAILLFLCACSMHKHHTQDNIVMDDQTSAQEDTFILGTVRVGQKDCQLYIETKENDELVKWYPVNLDESFQIEGMQIKFIYHPSRAKQPENCAVDKVIAVENVSQVNF